MIEIRRYVTADGRDLLHEWLSTLNDRRTRAKIAARINRLADGNFGDNKALGHGVYELRVDWGPGYRVYYALQGQHCVILLCGGAKRKQTSDIEKARKYRNDYKDRMSQ